MLRLITWYLVICLWESIVTSSLVKTSIAGTKTFCVPFPFCSLFLTVIQLLCFYSCYSLPPTPIHNFCWGRLKGTKEFIIFEPCHTFLARFLLMRDQDRISPNSINTISSRKRRKKEQMKERIYMGFTNIKYYIRRCYDCWFFFSFIFLFSLFSLIVFQVQRGLFSGIRFYQPILLWWNRPLYTGSLERKHCSWNRTGRGHNTGNEMCIYCSQV